MSNKTRAFLTILGIVIGTASVIVIMNVMLGLREYLVDSFVSHGTYNIEVTAHTEEGYFTQEELDRLVNDNPTVFTNTSPTREIGGLEISRGDTHFKINGTGVGLQYRTTNDVFMEKGEFLSYVDVVNSQPSIILGAYPKEALFGDEDAIGKTVKINGEEFVVKGVVQKKSGTENTQDSANNTFYIPYTTAAKFDTSDKVGTVIFSLTDETKIAEGKQILTDYESNKVGNEEDFSIYSGDEAGEEVDTIFSSISAVMILITGISLLVGGIGIMNITFITVVERTKEIGIRTAIGADPKLILRQFLIEAIVTSLVGGVIGIIIGLLLTVGAYYLMEEALYISVWSIVLSVGTSVGIGALFGYIPAKRASKMNPITALNTE